MELYRSAWLVLRDSLRQPSKGNVPMLTRAGGLCSLRLMMMCSLALLTSPAKMVCTRKLMPKYVGPFQIVKRVGITSYELDLPKNLRIYDVFHVSLLKPYMQGRGFIPPPPQLTDDGQVEFEVERILQHEDRRYRGGRCRRWFYVHWKGFDRSYDTWEPEANLTRAAPTSLLSIGPGFLQHLILSLSIYRARST